jgi:5-methylcytosine-specific restriction endonuclease McrA
MPRTYVRRNLDWSDPTQKKIYDQERYQEKKEEHKSRSKENYWNNREKQVEYNKKYYQENREKFKENYWDNREERLEHVKRYERENREKVRVNGERKRARKRNAPVNDFTSKQWKLLILFYESCCVYCGSRQTRITMDHIIPLSKGGSHTLSNILPCCLSCNSQKHNGPPLPVKRPLFLLSVRVRILNAFLRLKKQKSEIRFDQVAPILKAIRLLRDFYI